MKIINTEHFAIQRKIVACKTSESWQNVPHVCYNYEPEVSAFYDTYKKVFSSRCVENKITFNTLMLKVITEGLKQAPVMNSHITYNHRFLRGRIDTFETVNISVPTILPNGEMMTLNLRDFQNRDLEKMTASTAVPHSRILRNRCMPYRLTTRCRICARARLLKPSPDFGVPTSVRPK